MAGQLDRLGNRILHRYPLARVLTLAPKGAGDGDTNLITKTKNTMNKILITIAGILLAGASFFIGLSQNHTFGNAITQGIVPKVSTLSTTTVGTSSINTIVAANSACVSRTITTVAQPVMLSFSTMTPSAVAGIYQAASTTVTYDNAQFGCNAIKAYGYAASTTITVLEASQ